MKQLIILFLFTLTNISCLGDFLQELILKFIKMKNLSIIIIFSLFACQNFKGIKYLNNCENANITFKINIDKTNPNKINVIVSNKSDSNLLLSTPFLYPIVDYRIFDKEGVEFYKPLINVRFNPKNDTINISPKKDLFGVVKIGIDSYAGNSDIKKWHKIIAYYSYKIYKNCNNVITDTLINQN